MASTPLRSVILSLLRHLPPVDGTDDTALLERFVSWRDESAFELLVYRHGPMVRGVCRRVLRNEQDAEDAFQATFLTLAGQAAKVRRGSLPGWLFRVAFRTALKAKARAARRGTVAVPDDIAGGLDPADDVLTCEVRKALDEEILRLPERYRLPVVLCYLQGRSNREAALALGCPKGTIDSRLSEARRRLRGRLLRRGLAPAAGLALEGVLSESAGAGVLSGMVVRPVVRAALAFVQNQPLAAGTVSVTAASLAHEVLHTMYMTKLTWTAAIVLGLGLFGSGAGVVTYAALAGGQAPAADQAKVEPPAAKPASSPPQEPPDRVLVTKFPFATATGPANAAAVRELLRAPAGLEKPIEGMPLRDALDFLSQKFNVTIRVDPTALKGMGIEDPFALYDQKVRLPVVRGITFSDALCDLLAQVNSSAPDGVTFLVKGSHIAIVPVYKSPFPGVPGLYQYDTPIFNPAVVEMVLQGDLVSVDYRDKPLADVFRDLADSTGANIALDPRCKEQGKTLITVTLQNVRLLTALKVIADMAELRPAVMKNVYYVTSPANATGLERMEWPEPAVPDVDRPGAKPPQPPATKKGG